MYVLKIFYVIIIFLFLSCSENAFRRSFGKAQGTTYNIIYEYNKNLNDTISYILKTIDNSLSFYINNSTISKFNNAIDTFICNDKLFIKCFKQSKKIYKLTNGIFDPTVYPLISYWGFGKNNKYLSSVDTSRIDSLKQLVGMDKILLKRINEGFLFVKLKHNYPKLDFNAIAQGFSVDIISSFFDSLNIKNYLIEIGGEVKCKGKNEKKNKWKIGVDNPLYPQKHNIFSIIKLKSKKSLATSGIYRKKYQVNNTFITHTVNPKTGYPQAHNLLSASIISDSCAVADAFATVAIVEGKQFLHNIATYKTKYKLQYFLIFHNLDKLNFIASDNIDFKLVDDN